MKSFEVARACYEPILEDPGHYLDRIFTLFLRDGD